MNHFLLSSYPFFGGGWHLSLTCCSSSREYMDVLTSETNQTANFSMVTVYLYLIRIYLLISVLYIFSHLVIMCSLIQCMSSVSTLEWHFRKNKVLLFLLWDKDSYTAGNILSNRFFFSDQKRETILIFS